MNKKATYEWTEYQKSAGLAQSCKQLRKEFLPLLLHHVQHHLKGQEMHDYIETFNSSMITIHVPVRIDFHGMEDETVELLPLLKMAAKTWVSCYFLLKWPEGTTDQVLDKLSSTATLVKAWRDFAGHSVSSIKYRVNDPQSFEIVVKQAAKEAWMPWDPRVDAATRPKKDCAAATLWRFRIGIGHLPMPKVEVVEDRDARLVNEALCGRFQSAVGKRQTMACAGAIKSCNNIQCARESPH